MHQLKRHILLATTAIAWWGCAALAQAQPMPAAPMGPECPAWQNGHMDPAQQKNMRHRMEQRQTRLKEALKLSPEQEAAWTQFTQSMQPMPHPQSNPGQWQQLTTPQRIEKMQALQAEHAALMDKHLKALTQFYNVLTPEQQKTFDQQHVLPGFAEHPHRRPAAPAKKPPPAPAQP